MRHWQGGTVLPALRDPLRLSIPRTARHLSYIPAKVHTVPATSSCDFRDIEYFV